MPTKEGNGGYGQESYDPKTGKYVSNGGGSSSGDESLSDTLRQALLMGNYKGVNLKSINVSAVVSKNITTKMQDKVFADKVNKANEIYNSNDLTKLFKKKDREYSPLEDCFCVNDRNHSKGWSFQNNCQRCAPTWVARFCWGLDVEACPAFKERGWYDERANKLNPWSDSTIFSVYKGWENSDVHHCSMNRESSWRELDEFMKDLPDKATCQIVVRGHTFTASKINGRVYAIEPQCPHYYGDMNNPVECMDKMDKDHRERYRIQYFMRVDNLMPSPRITGMFQDRKS